MPRVNPVSCIEHAHKCPHCNTTWVCDGPRNLCTRETRAGLGGRACLLCMHPDLVRARGIRAQLIRDQERLSGQENVYFKTPLLREAWRPQKPHESKAFEDYMGEWPSINRQE